MKLDSAAGSHVAYPTGPSHLPEKQVVCDPLRFTLPRESIKPADGSTVTFDLAAVTPVEVKIAP